MLCAAANFSYTPDTFLDYTLAAPQASDYGSAYNVYDSDNPRAALPDGIAADKPFPAVDYDADYATANKRKPE